MNITQQDGQNILWHRECSITLPEFMDYFFCVWFTASTKDFKMADSDDEFDRKKGRDKFRRERNDYERRNDDRRRDAWDDR